MKVLQIELNNFGTKQYIIGQAKEFQEMEPTMRIIDPNLKGVVDYLSYNETKIDVGIPVIIPKTYHFEDISYSPTLTIEERKDGIINEYVNSGVSVKIVKWEDIK